MLSMGHGMYAMDNAAFSGAARYSIRGGGGERVLLSAAAAGREAAEEVSAG